MMKTLRIFLVSILATLAGCGDLNVLDRYSSADSDDARYFEAKKLLDRSEWDQVVNIIENQLSAGFAGKDEVQETLASAYAGKCGYTFADILAGLQNINSPVFFPMFFEIFSLPNIDTASCDQAISIIQGLGPYTERTENQKLFLTILGMARVGTMLNAKLDPGQTGTLPGNPEVCSSSAGGAVFSNDEVRVIASGIGLIFENITALTNALGADGAGSLGGLTDALDSCSGLAVGVNCNETDPAAVENPHVYAIRVLMESGNYGFKDLGTCDVNTDPAGCCVGTNPLNP